MSNTPLDVDNAFAFYQAFILDYSHQKAAIYEQYGFSLQGSIGAKDWEVFAAILVGDRANDRAKPRSGSDLMRHEVKSAVFGSSFEYQYHRQHGLAKLADDQQIDHIFIARSANYRAVDVWRVDSEELAATFASWRPALQANYDNPSRQRFRRSISYRLVTTQGQRLLQIQAGRLVYPRFVYPQ